MVDFNRNLCNDLDAASRREWLVTNGTGSYASGTISGILTRRYHGLLVAALKPPLGRTLLVTKVDEIAEYGGQSFSLGANRWAGGAVDPRGFEYLERFRLEGTTTVWSFTCGDALLEKRIWMEHGADTTYVSYTVVEAKSTIRLTAKVLVNYRDFHSCTHGGEWHMDIQPVEHGLRVTAFAGATPFHLLSPELAAEPAHIWHRNYDLALERSRGFDSVEDHLHAATFGSELAAGDSANLVFSIHPAPDLGVKKSWKRRLTHERDLVTHWKSAHSTVAGTAPPWVRQLVLAADQFVVARPLPADPKALSVIAGFPWFGDWGRDTMIALPGMAISTGRKDAAKSILRTFAQFVDQGMLPNYFPEAGAAPELNNVDAALWYVEAVRQYVAATRDTKTLRELFPALADIINHYVRGTRFDIHVDRVDGLIWAGEPGVALTWMDARVGDRPVTPRIGKPVEINALWFAALQSMARFARQLRKPSSYYLSRAALARDGFQRFWNGPAQCCYDVLDGPLGPEAAIRPNQILAVSLGDDLLKPEQMRAVVDCCEKNLLTPRGLRSLAPDDPQYRGHYSGPPQERDAAYHQGTVWGWLLGPFALAHLKVYGDAARARAFLEPMAQAMAEYGVGTLGEIFDGDSPHAPRGCIAQAWTVGEILRAWSFLHPGGRIIS